MIARIRGELIQICDGTLIIESGGIGYKIRVPENVLTQSNPGQEIILHTELIIRQDLLQLYGFLTTIEADLFRLLISVSHIGPQTGIALLSSLTIKEIHYAIKYQKPEILSKVPGLGKKGAERIILELKNKISDSTIETDYILEESTSFSDALLALKSLGYNSDEASSVLLKVQKEKTLKGSSDLVKEALVHLRKK